MLEKERNGREGAVRLDGDAMLVREVDGGALFRPVVRVQPDLVHRGRDGGELEERLQLWL